MDDLFERLSEEKEMFGIEKDKIQLRSVEDYMKTQDVLDAGAEDKPPKRRFVISKAKSLIGPVIGVLFIVALVAAALSQFNSLRSEIAEVKSEGENEVKELKLQVSDLTTKVGTSEKQAAQLTDSISRLEKELEAERTERMKVADSKRAAATARTRGKKSAKNAAPSKAPKKIAPKKG